MRAQSQRFDSRQVMTRQTFEIFHYRDSKMENVAMHHHDFYEIFFFLGGEVEYRVEGRTFHLEPGDVLLINPQELHQPLVTPGVPYERIVLWIDRGFLDHLSSEGADLARCFDVTLPTHTNLLRPTTIQRTAITARLSDLIREAYSEEYGSSICAAGIFLQFMAELNRLAQDTAIPRAQAEESPLADQVLAYLSAHCCENISLEQVAQHFYVSKYHLSHAFAGAVGISIYRYVILKRLLTARQMLSEGLSPGIVSQSCGFGDYTNFYRAFRAEYGISPKEYAAQCVGK